MCHLLLESEGIDVENITFVVCFKLSRFGETLHITYTIRFCGSFQSNSFERFY